MSNLRNRIASMEKTSDLALDSNKGTSAVNGAIDEYLNSYISYIYGTSDLTPDATNEADILESIKHNPKYSKVENLKIEVKEKLLSAMQIAQDIVDEWYEDTTENYPEMFVNGEE